MTVQKLLIANRGEIAIRIIRAASELDIATVAVNSEDDSQSLHTRLANETVALRGRGAAAYLDIEQIVSVATSHGCDAIHPGYGFLAENADLARAAEAAGLQFVGPTPAHLELFGDKIAARAAAVELGVPVVPATKGAVSLEEAAAFLAAHGPVMARVAWSISRR